MKTSRKIALGLLIILIIVGGYLYFRGGEVAQRDGQGERQNPIFSFETGGDGFFGGEGEEDADNEQDEDASTPAPSLWRVSSEPVAGSGWVDRGAAEEVIWHVRASNGHVYQSSPDARQPTRLTNTTIPQVREALIAPDGSYIIYRYLSDNGQIKTFRADLTPSNDAGVPFSIDGEFLSDDISAISLSPSGEEIFYLQPTRSGVVGVIYDSQTAGSEVVFTSEIRQWRVSWNTPEAITLFTAPAEEATGFSYTLDPATGRLEKLAEGKGLTTFQSPDERFLLKSSYQNGGEYRAQVSKLTDPRTNLMSPRTLAQKCAWAESTTAFFCGVPKRFPDNPLKDWYQGRFQYDDTLVLFNPQNRDQSALFSAEELEEGPFDITRISVDETFHYLLFTNKSSGHLWGFVL